MTTKFNIGDRIVMSLPNSCVPINSTGTIVGMESCLSAWLEVHWDTPLGFFHNCDGKCPDNTGWSVDSYLCKLLVAGPVLTTQEKVLAKMKDLDERFKNKTLRKVSVTKLPLGT